jgi:cell division protein FtsN
VAARKKPPAKRGASRYKAPAKKPVPGWIWLACGLAVGVFVMLLMNLQPGGDAVKRNKAETARASQSKPKSATQSQEPGKPKYDFYTLLPDSEVIVPADALPPPAPAQPAVTPAEAAKIDAARALAALNGETPPPAPPVAPAPAPAAAQAPLSTQFFLQAGSFRRKDDAESVRAQIILLGQNVRVESGTVREETWYRVLVGPFANREQLAVSQKALSANGFGNLLLQQRQNR